MHILQSSFYTFTALLCCYLLVWKAINNKVSILKNAVTKTE